MKHLIPPIGALVLALAVVGLAVSAAGAANHREAPLTALDRTADITDFFAFVSYDDPERVTLVLAVDPLLEPSNGPNYFPFDPEIVYAIRIDNNHDAVEDVVFEFRFRTEQRLPGVFTGFVGAGNGLVSPDSSPPPVPPGTPIVPPAITALDGPGSEGLGLRQRYSISMLRRVDNGGNGGHSGKGGKGDRWDEDEEDHGDRSGRGHRSSYARTTLATGLFAVPTNVGPRTMPDYPALADQGIHDIGRGVRAFAGTVEDPFWIDLGATFDSLNFRPGAFATAFPGVLSPAQDADDTRNFAPDDVAGFNVNAIAIEVPIAMLTKSGRREPASSPFATIGTWGTTSRPRTKMYTGPGRDPRLSNQLVQIQRMGNPLINELIIGTGSKDKFSMSRPADDAQFADFALDPLLARVLNAIYGDALPVPTPPRTDLLLLVQYLPPIATPGTPAGPVADLLRLNTGVPPTSESERKRLGVLAGDFAGFPNGRRVSDDVTDIAARVVAGVLAGPPFNGFPHTNIGDGVNTNDAPYRETFPYLGFAHSGRDSRHVDPGEDGLPVD